MIQLDKILEDINEEISLHPNYPKPDDKRVIDDAWSRVGKKNALSAHESRSIFRVLQKKYEQEKVKPKSSWKLFDIMESIHAVPIKTEEGIGSDADMPSEEDEEYEMFDVQDEDDDGDIQLSPTSQPTNEGKGIKNSKLESDKDDKAANKPNKRSTTIATEHDENPVKKEEQKILNSSLSTFLKHSQQNQNNLSIVSTPDTTDAATHSSKQTNSKLSVKAATSSTSAAANALQRKGITLKKTGSTVSNATTTPNNKPKPKLLNSINVCASSSSLNNVSLSGDKHVSYSVRHPTQLQKMTLPETIKRKLSEEQNSRALPSHAAKKSAISSSLSGITTTDTIMTVSSTNSSNNKSNEVPTSGSAGNSNANSFTTNGLNILSVAEVKQEQNSFEETDSTEMAKPSDVNIGSNVNNSNSNNASITSQHGISLITLPASTSNNSSAANLVDLRNSIIFDANGTSSIKNESSLNTHSNICHKAALNGDSAEHTATTLSNADSIIFDNTLPSTFLKNISNSSRFEALGFYVANVLNRLDKRAAKRVESQILRAIIEAQESQE